MRRFAGSPVRRFAGSPVRRFAGRRFAGSPVRRFAGYLPRRFAGGIICCIVIGRARSALCAAGQDRRLLHYKRTTRFQLRHGIGIRNRSDLGLCPWGWSTRYCTNRRERPSLLDLLSEFGLISDGWLGSISPLEIGPMHLSVEGLRHWDWSYPVLQYLREWPTPTVVSSLSRVLS